MHKSKSTHSIDSEPVSGSQIYDEHTYHILLIANEVHLENEFSPQGLSISYAIMENAMNAIRKMVPDAVLVWFEPHISFCDDLPDLKRYLENHSLPFILYTSEFNREAREAAQILRFDEYYHGPFGESLLKKFKIIKKAKEHKNEKRKAQTTGREHSRREFVILRRAFDLAASMSILVLLSPLLLLIALIIKMESRGPIFYISKRAGNNYKVFDFYKFRSMVPGADSQLQKLSDQNQYGEGVFVKIKNDPRVTPFGRFLRKTSLDEIPQLINIIKGDMSLVGNRPLPLYEAEQLTKDVTARRFLAPAGVTGLWQVTKRGKDQMSEEERIHLDIEYAQNYSFFYDLRLIVSTIPALLQKEAV